MLQPFSYRPRSFTETVFDVLGRKVAIILDEELAPKRYNEVLARADTTSQRGLIQTLAAKERKPLTYSWGCVQMMRGGITGQVNTFWGRLPSGMKTIAFGSIYAQQALSADPGVLAFLAGFERGAAYRRPRIKVLMPPSVG